LRLLTPKKLSTKKWKEIIKSSYFHFTKPNSKNQKIKRKEIRDPNQNQKSVKKKRNQKKT
jgi:hypothetical protein